MYCHADFAHLGVGQNREQLTTKISMSRGFSPAAEDTWKDELPGPIVLAGERLLKPFALWSIALQSPK